MSTDEEDAQSTPEDQGKNTSQEENQIEFSVGYLFGGLLILGGLGILASSVTGGILAIIAGFISMPLSDKYMSSYLGFTLSSGMKVIAVLILMGIAGSTVGGTTPTSTTDTNPSNSAANTQAATSADNQQPQEEKTWQTVDSWSGSGMKSTEPFTISGNEWRIKWEATPQYRTGSVFQLSVKEPGGQFPVDMAANVANMSESRSNTSYVYESGRFYLEVNGANASWSVEVQELR